jgi:hypothetical protein
VAGFASEYPAGFNRNPHHGLSAVKKARQSDRYLEDDVPAPNRSDREKNIAQVLVDSNRQPRGGWFWSAARESWW